jgi:hypothetical protein
MTPIDPDERVACQGADLDFTMITRATPSEVVAEARSTCVSCPALLACLTYLETTEVAGFAGGMFEIQRKRWRRRDRQTVEDVTIRDVSEASELKGPILDGLQVRSGRALTRDALELVLRLTEAGLSAEEIVSRIGSPDLTHRTVKYIRHHYADDTLTRRRRQRSIANDSVAARRRVIRQWAIEQGLDVPADPSRPLLRPLLVAYRTARQQTA